MYNVDYKKIAYDNMILPDEPLVVGQTIVIIINKDMKKFRDIEVNGYAFPQIDIKILENTLPYLTYLSIFSYELDYSGNIKSIADEKLIMMAKNYNVLPVMVVTNIGIEGRFDSDLARFILRNESAQKKLIDNILNILDTKGYAGLNIDFEYVYPDDKEVFIDFIDKIKSEMAKKDYFLFASLAPKTSEEQQGLLYEAHDYEKIGELVDRVIIMTYEWGYSGGPARAVAPINLVEKVLEYAVSAMPSDKILMGIPNYGYDWILPYIEGSLAKSVGNYEAVDIARLYRQTIKYNYDEQAPYFNYYDQNIIKHEVWFEDARSIQAKLELVIKYNLAGVSYWTITRIFPQNYLVLKSMFNIKKYY